VIKTEAAIWCMVSSSGPVNDIARGAGPVLAPDGPIRDLHAETATRSTTTQIYEGTNQIQRMVMARQLLKG
jgi:alkylation response protein AidB-like acyl-CoA dehydrogenase